MKIDRLFEIASRIHQGDAHEAELRSSVNRYYYFCHLTVRSWAERFAPVDFEGDAGDHNAAMDALREISLSGIADRMEWLKTTRGVADYELQREITGEHADRARVVAEDLFSRLGEQGILPSEHFRGDFNLG